MNLTQVKNILIACAHSQGRPEYPLCTARDVHAAIQNHTDHPLKDLVLQMNKKHEPVTKEHKTQAQKMQERSTKQIPLLKKYLEKNGAGCWAALARKSKGVVHRQQLYNAIAGRVTIGEQKWEVVEALILDELDEVA